jgi:hypothetical protein
MPPHLFHTYCKDPNPRAEHLSHKLVHGEREDARRGERRGAAAAPIGARAADANAPAAILLPACCGECIARRAEARERDGAVVEERDEAAARAHGECARRRERAGRGRSSRRAPRIRERARRAVELRFEHIAAHRTGGGRGAAERERGGGGTIVRRGAVGRARSRGGRKRDRERLRKERGRRERARICR